MSGYFENKVAFVTGAGGGIGAAVARQFGALGCKTVVSDIDAAAAERVTEAIVAAGGSAVSRQLDVTDHEAMEAAIAFTVQSFGGLDLAVNNAGITGGIAPLADFSIEDWHRTIAADLHSVFYGLKYQLRVMAGSGGGAIVNMSSILGTVASATVAGYVAAKHGVIGLTKTAALDYAQQGIRVNAIGPGYIDTAMMAAAEPEAREALIAMHPIGRLGTAEEVADLAIFLLSDKASFITGSYHVVDGGFSAT